MTLQTDITNLRAAVEAVRIEAHKLWQATSGTETGAKLTGVVEALTSAEQRLRPEPPGYGPR